MNLDKAKERIKELEKENKKLRKDAIEFSDYVLKTNEDIRLFIQRIKKHAKKISDEIYDEYARIS